MNIEIEISLDHIHEDMVATVTADISFHRDSHGAPYGYESWVEFEILKQVITVGQDEVSMPIDLEKQINKEIEKEILAAGNRQRWEVA